MWYGYLADVVVAFHLAYMAFVIFGLLAVVVGGILKWGWVRNFWFRLAHFTAIAVVAFEAIIDFTCPLTTLEDTLRKWAGQKVEEGTFIGRHVHDMLFFPNVPQWVFTSCYIGFALLVFVTFFLVPPRLPQWRRSRQVTSGPVGSGQSLPSGAQPR
jgi:hypothetical protein